MLDRDQRPRDTPDGPVAAPEAADPGWLVAPYPPFAPDDLQHALNHNQIACKTWLLDALFEALGGRFATVTVLGGWYGLLGALLLGDGRFQVDRVLSYDLDPDCARVAEWLNRKHTPDGRFQAVTADVRELDYERPEGPVAAPGAAGNGAQAPDLVINTSCEHITPTEAWYARIPPGTLQVLQSNDYFDCPDHVNCQSDLEAFKEDQPMRALYYQGSMARKRYTRFMLIGRK